MSEACPDWRRAARNRLHASIALSAVVIAALIWLVDFRRDVARPSVIELRLLKEAAVESAEEVAPAAVETAEAGPDPALVADEARAESVEPRDLEDSAAEFTDWYGQIEAAVVSTRDEAAASVSVNPGFDRKRREAAARYAPKRAARPVPIWENVETDQLGRKILVSGHCYRVIDDPSAVNYEVFRTFHQHFVQCADYRRPARELPWVAELRNRYDYLSGDDPSARETRKQLTAELNESAGSASLR